jgi:pSer/pThr/pTyr-binding forkhead associated (FHA) protein
MPISTVFEKLGKAIFETPFGANRLSKDAPEMAEIRIAVLDAVKAKSHRASGKHVFPFNLVRVELRGVPENQVSVFEGEFLASYFAQEIKTSLGRAHYRFPADLQVEVHASSVLPLEREPWIVVETAQRKPDTSEASEQTRSARLVVLEGAANVQALAIDKARVNIGRTVEVFRSGGPSRRNDLAFTEDNERNATVSREHAHIIRSSRTGECRVYNDRNYKGEANCGIWIVRDGLSQPVHRGTRGTLLRSGDEIHFGRTVVRFEAGSELTE